MSDRAINNPIPAYRSILHALNTIYRNEGLKAMYRGVLINMIAGSIANSVFFAMYQDGKTRYGFDPNNPDTLKTIIISWRSGLISMAITAPLWTIKTRMITFREAQDMSAFKQLHYVATNMYKQEGIPAFFKGYLPGIFLSTYGVIQMYTYEKLNFLFGYTGENKKNMSSWIPFFTGALSKSTASVILNPLNVVRMRLQAK